MTTAIDVETVAPEQALAVREAVPAALEYVPAPTTPAQAKVDAIAELTRTAYQKASQLELTDAEIADLTADFPDEAFKPGAAGKENLIYIEHAFLRDRLNKVFRPGRWAIVPRNRWAEDFKTSKGTQASRVYVEAMLVIRGCFAAEAVGEMEYYPNNASQNYGDAVEGAKTAALRRCCKELGIGLQAWKKDWCEGWWQRRTSPKAAQNAPGRSGPLSTGHPPPQNSPQPTQRAAVKPAEPNAITELLAKVLRGMDAKPDVRAQAEAYGRKCLAKFIAKVDGMGTNARAVAWAFAQESNWILPNEDLESVPVDKAPLGADEFAAIMAEIATRLTDHHAVDAAYDGYMDACGTKGKEPPPEVTQAINQGTQAGNLDPNSPDAPWRSFPLPFGKDAGKPLAELDKKKLFGWWANHEVETEYNGKPIAAEKVLKSQRLREMLDQCALHYGFELKG